MIKVVKLNIVLFFFTLIISSCGGNIKADMDVEKVKDEIASRKIKHFTDAQITQAAYDFGKEFIEKEKFNSVNCNSSMLRENNNKIIDSCFLICNDSLISNEKEKLIWQAYNKNFEQGALMSSNIQEVDNNYFLYTTPLTSLANINKEATKSFEIVFLRINKKNLIKNM